jgi:sec-independent protein translocase protein TatB
MFDVGWSEILVIAVVAIVVIGPKDLPRAMRTVGKWSGKMRRMAREFQNQFNEALREAELDDVKKEVETISRMDPLADVKKDLKTVEANVATELNKTETAPAAAPAMAAPEPAVPVAAPAPSPATVMMPSAPAPIVAEPANAPAPTVVDKAS